MKTKEQRNVHPASISTFERPITAQPWPAEPDERDNLSPPRPLREPRFNDGDLLDGDGP
jgi:hypothetical protein